MSPRCYGQRLLQPFRGAAQIVEIDGADAVSRDGVHWELYIQGGVDRERDERGAWIEIPLSDIKFGSWTASGGLSRYPTRHVTDYDRIDQLGSRLLDAVRGAAPRVPLPLEDVYELWLLDAEDAPLALIDARRDGTDGGDPAPGDMPAWRPGQIARQEFARERSDGVCDHLARIVNARARRAAWFRRDGTRMHESPFDSAAPNGTVRAAAEFPELLLHEAWASAADRDLIARFLEWQAPWLLTLPELTVDTRARLETAAYRAALRVEGLYRCYPEILDDAGLKAALVEASLRRAAGDERPNPGADGGNFFVSGN